MKIGIERKITIWFILVLCLGIYFTYIAFKSKNDHQETGNWVRLSYEIQAEIQDINNYIQQMEISSHEYLLSGRKEFIHSYNSAFDSLRKGIKSVSELTRDNSRQQELISILSELTCRQQVEYSKFINVNDPIERHNSLEKTAGDYSQNLIDSLRIITSKMDSLEDGLLEKRLLFQQNASVKSKSSLITLVVLFLLIFGIFYWLILYDIKQRRITEEKLANSEAFLYMIFNESNDALFLVESKSNLIEKCNKAAVRMFEFESEQDMLKTFGPGFHKSEFCYSDLNEINEALQKDGLWKNEVIYKTNSGSEFWGAVSIIAFVANSIKYKLVRIIDVTERKNSEQALKNYAEALERSKYSLHLLTKELLIKNDKLEKSEADLKDLNASKDKFFSILAHDMKSPFMGLLGIAKYMADCQDLIPKNEMKELSEVLHASAKKIFDLLNNLLEWSRLQTGGNEYIPSETNLKKIIEEILDLQRSNAESKDICLNNEISEDIRIYADHNMVATIFRNLISNAIKFTGHGGKVTLSAAINSFSVEICVKDTGNGMSEDVKNKIFRIDSKYTTKGTNGEEGTGLGLVICKDLVEKNHGRIWVESQLGSGTMFFISLPLVNKN